MTHSFPTRRSSDLVIRREFRLHEGDAFNSFQVKRSADRIKSLGYFQEKLEVAQKPGSAPDRIVLETNVEEKSTGELQLTAGFSSLEGFIQIGRAKYELHSLMRSSYAVFCLTQQ